MFPLMVHRFQTNPQFRERVSCHWHNELEILIVTEGAAQIQIDDKSYMVKEGEMVFVLPNRLHSAQAEEGTPFSFLAVVFDEALLNSFVRDEITGLINYIDKTFGKSGMQDSKAYLRRIQNLY